MNRRDIFSLLAGLTAVGLSRPALARDDDAFPINQSDANLVPRRYRRRTVRFDAPYEPGTIVVDTRQKYLYLVQPGGRAIRYGIGVGRQGFSWSGAAVIKRKAKWPRWTPPAEMVKRDKFAAEWANGMPGGPKNPLGARALYLFQGNVDTLYRIHGTYVPSSIGKAVSSGCIRLINADVAHLYERVPTGTRVVVLQGRSIRSQDEPPRVARRKRRWLFGGMDDED
ncbi:MAG: L,D-transpeptidase [Proteobacteria bacterium]|nr:L,D-transpeptidase [Pseudomonadota bacterium]